MGESLAAEYLPVDVSAASAYFCAWNRSLHRCGIERSSSDTVRLDNLPT